MKKYILVISFLFFSLNAEKIINCKKNEIQVGKQCFTKVLNCAVQTYKNCSECEAGFQLMDQGCVKDTKNAPLLEQTSEKYISTEKTNYTEEQMPALQAQNIIEEQKPTEQYIEQMTYQIGQKEHIQQPIILPQQVWDYRLLASDLYNKDADILRASKLITDIFPEFKNATISKVQLKQIYGFYKITFSLEGAKDTYEAKVSIFKHLPQIDYKVNYIKKNDIVFFPIIKEDPIEAKMWTLLAPGSYSKDKLFLIAQKLIQKAFPEFNQAEIKEVYNKQEYKDYKIIFTLKGAKDTYEAKVQVPFNQFEDDFYLEYIKKNGGVFYPKEYY